VRPDDSCGRIIISTIQLFQESKFLPASTSSWPKGREGWSAVALVAARFATAAAVPRCASLHVFGSIIPALNLAANWLRFLRATPAPGMVATRRGHVFVLERHIRGSNSGRHRTRVHPRSIAGFQIVNPNASRMAMQ
jgi:hypothetical protein